jgi:PD-(D/E)XK nuclease superfamily
LQQDAELQRCMVAFSEIAPDIFLTADGQMFRESEHYRTLQVQDYLLTVVYDLLIADGTKAQILDWKTYPKPANKEKLANHWQTLLYLYVLAETSDYQPEQISMTYWFIQSEGKLQNIKFAYSHAQHIANTKKLDSLLCQLTNWLQPDALDPFPQVPVGSKICDKCQYITRCGRDFHSQAITNQTTISNSVDSTLQNLATIQEVML